MLNAFNGCLKKNTQMEFAEKKKHSLLFFKESYMIIRIVILEQRKPAYVIILIDSTFF